MATRSLISHSECIHPSLIQNQDLVRLCHTGLVLCIHIIGEKMLSFRTFFLGIVELPEQSVEQTVLEFSPTPRNAWPFKEKETPTGT
jgi:hypothetical protein